MREREIFHRGDGKNSNGTHDMNTEGKIIERRKRESNMGQVESRPQSVRRMNRTHIMTYIYGNAIIKHSTLYANFKKLR